MRRLSRDEPPSGRGPGAVRLENTGDGFDISFPDNDLELYLSI
jgi:hypothetical protein